MTGDGVEQLTRRGALAVIGAGAASVVSPSGAFSNATASRATNVSVANDPNALIGLAGTTDTGTTPTFTNNTSGTMTVTLSSAEDVEFDVGDNGNWAAPPVSFQLDAGAATAVNIRFVGECADAGSATVNINGQNDDGSLLIDMTREFEIPEAGQVQFNGTASSAGASGQYEFEIENTGCVDVTFTGIGINETTSSAAEYVSGGGSMYADGTEVVTDEIPFDSGDPSTDTRRDMIEPVLLPQTETVTFEFTKFMRNQNGGGPGGGSTPHVDMRGEDLRLTFYLSDGSSATIELCLGSCDF